MTVESLVGRIEVMSQVVEMQAEEIRQLRQTTARLETKLARRKAAHSESRQLVEELRERQREAEQEHARKRRKVEERLALAATKPTTSTSITGASSHSITSSSSSSSSSPSPSSTSSPLAVPVSANAAIGGLQSEIHRRMPFLRHYDIRASAIINFSYPVCSFELPGPGGFTDAPPVLVYANAAFCHLTNYPLERLLGTPYHFTYVINLQHYKQAMVIGNNRPPFGVTEVYKYQSLLRCDGCLLRVDQNHQFFCDESGKLRYSLLCITDWDEGRLGETEILGQWLPPSAIGITADGAAAAPESPPPLQPQLQPPPVPTMSLPLSLELMPSLLPPPHQQPQLIYPAHEQQQHHHHHHHHPALQQQQQHPPPAYPLNHLQNQHQHPHQHQTHPQLHQQQLQHRPPPHPNAVQSDAEMAGWLMDYPYPSESWPSV